MISKLTFNIPEGISDPKILQYVSRFTDCDLWSILTLHYRISDKYFLPYSSLTRHNKVPAFLTWLRSLSMAFAQFFIAQFSFLAKIWLFLSVTRKNSLQNFVDQSRLYLAPVVQRPDNFIQWISHYPTVSICAKISVLPRVQVNMHTLTTAKFASVWELWTTFNMK